MLGNHMQKKSKKMIPIGLLCIVIVAVAGIAVGYYRKEKEKVEQNTILPDSVCLSGRNNFTDQGMLYFNDHFIRFANAETGIDSVICTDTNCRHEDAHNSECGAYLGGGGCSGLVQRGDRIYYLLYDNETEKQVLYSANLQGKDRTKIAELMEMNLVVDVIYHSQSILISYVNTDNETNGIDTCGIYGFDLEKKEGKLYYQKEGNGAAINSLSLQGDVLYFSYHGSDAGKEDILKHSNDEDFEAEHSETVVKGIRLADGKETMSVEGYGCNCILPYCSGKLFFTRDDVNYYYDESSKECVKISEDNLVPVYSPTGKDVLFIDSGENGKYRYLRYNSEQLKMETLGESDLYALVVLEKKTYVLLEDDEGYGCLDTKDFLQGKYSKLIHF